MAGGGGWGLSSIYINPKKKLKKKQKKNKKKKNHLYIWICQFFYLPLQLLKIIQNLHLCQLLLEAMKAWYWIGWEGYNPM